MSDDHVLVKRAVQQPEQQQADPGIRLIVPGDQYLATLLSAKRQTFFQQTNRIEFWWRVVSDNFAVVAELPGYCTMEVGKRQKPASKFAGWQSLIAIYTGGSPSHVTLKSFDEFVFRVEVQTVLINGNRKTRTDREQYSQVRDLLEVIGPRRTDRP